MPLHFQTITVHAARVNVFKLSIAVLLLLSNMVPAMECLGQTSPHNSISPSDTTLWDVMYSDVKIVLEDGIAFATAPMRFETDDWIYLGVLLGGTAATITRDAKLREFTLRNKETPSGVRTALDIGTIYGDAFEASMAGAAVYLGGLVLDLCFDSGPWEYGELRGVARMVGETLFFAGSIAAGLRSVFGRKRPYHYPPGEEEVWAFELFNLKTHVNAFPSGHSVVTMALTTSLAEYFDTWIARAILYPVAALGLYSRLISDGHWFSDVVFGAGIGTAAGLYMADRQHRRENAGARGEGFSSRNNFKLYPAPGGVVVIFYF